MKKLKLKENEVVHCATLKQAKKVLEIAHELGLKDIGCKSYLKTNYWNNYKEKTVFYFNLGQYGNIDLVVEGYEIITSKEFIKRYKKENKYKSLEDKLNLIIQEKDKEIKAINDLFCNVLNRINVLEAIVNATNESVTIVKSEEACNDLEQNKYTLENVQVDCRELSEEQIKEMCKVYESNGFKKWDKIDEYPFSKHMPFLSYDEESGSKGYYYHAKQNRKHTISYDKFIELFGNKQPQIGDVVKAWCDHETDFIYGVLKYIDIDKDYHFSVGRKWFKNIEKVTEISINDFRK